MNDPTISGLDVHHLETLIRNSEFLRSLVDSFPDFRELLFRAAEVASARGDLASLIAVVARVGGAGDRVILATCSENDAELAMWTQISEGASKDLGIVLQELCPDARPIGGDVSAAPAN
jgi:hypothetical protein